MKKFIVQAKNLRKNFNEVNAVDGVDLCVEENEIFGLVGPDGSGKTTTIRMLCGILDPSGGEAEVLGMNVFSNSEQVKPQIGYMPQRFSLYHDLTVEENLRFFANIYHVPRKEFLIWESRLMEFSRLGPFRSRLAGQLSGGMKQKLALACTLIHTPKILFLDEPTTGVDPVSRRDFWLILSELLGDGITLFLTTPYMDEAERCNHVALIEKGKILTCNSPSGLKNSMGGKIYEVISDSQRLAIEVLKAVPRVSGVRVFGDRLHIWVKEEFHDEGNRLTDSNGGLPISGQMQIEEALCRKNIVISQIREINPSLEDVFISLVSRENRKSGEKS